MAATNTPTSWAATGLPSGMEIDSTGLISGTATAAGVYLIKVTATNGDGSSTPLDIAMGIEDTNYNDGLGIEVNIDAHRNNQRVDEPSPLVAVTKHWAAVAGCR